MEPNEEDHVRRIARIRIRKVFEQIQRLGPELSPLSMRSGIVVLASVLDAQLGKVLGAALRRDSESPPTGTDHLVRGMNSRIGLAAALGLIDNGLGDGLDSLRRARNRAAHFDDALDFSEVLDGCAPLIDHFSGTERFQERIATLGQIDGNHLQPEVAALVPQWKHFFAASMCALEDLLEESVILELLPPISERLSELDGHDWQIPEVRSL